jgi:hypothetical protein
MLLIQSMTTSVERIDTNAARMFSDRAASQKIDSAASEGQHQCFDVVLLRDEPSYFEWWTVVEAVD